MDHNKLHNATFRVDPNMKSRSSVKVSEVAHEEIDSHNHPVLHSFNLFAQMMLRVKKCMDVEREFEIPTILFLFKTASVPTTKSKFLEPPATVCWGSLHAILRLQFPWHPTAADRTINKALYVS
jgi:hypothetical protein